MSRATEAFPLLASWARRPAEGIPVGPLGVECGAVLAKIDALYASIEAVDAENDHLWIERDRLRGLVIKLLTTPSSPPATAENVAVAGADAGAAAHTAAPVHHESAESWRCA